MKEIKLTKGLTAVVDDEDYEVLNKYSWSVSEAAHLRYAIRTSSVADGRKTIRMHRQIMEAAQGQEVDHINGNGLNNCKSNLRICNRLQNAGNYSKPITNKSGYKGVQYAKHAKMFRARIQVSGKTIYLGYYKDPVEAAKSYDDAAVKYFGEFAKRNFK